MREIKFRVWCKQNETIQTVSKIGFMEDKLWYVEDEDHETQPPYFEDDDDWVLMQFTGLKDKDDNEIYEGDIVLLKNEFTTWKGTVVFDEGAFKLSIKHSWGTSVEHFNKTNVFNDMGARIQLNNIYLVVGNIYENPELLEDSQNGTK
ncbi:YopX family protein [Lysinibacillus irui]|uniref:YopX family protein n=1 Tax=Lysinibacillus irui TaxID=2998077 RepID=UPI002AD4878C|nr:YopX family protein [Lysinibacillus irui]MEA0564072.1 YopX family protein [Lysinibacillus irui]